MKCPFIAHCKLRAEDIQVFTVIYPTPRRSVIGQEATGIALRCLSELRVQALYRGDCGDGFLWMRDARLLPFCPAFGQAVFAMAIGAVVLLGGTGEKGLVLLQVILILGMTSLAKLIDFLPAIHDVGRRPFSAPLPASASHRPSQP